MLFRTLDNKWLKTTTWNIIVNVPKTEKNIYNLKYLANLVVRVKAYRSDPHKSTQCHNCQLYGPASYSCHVKPECVKCGGSHQGTCGGEHPASYLGCKENPLRRPKSWPTATTHMQPFIWGQQRNENLRTQPQPKNQQPVAAAEPWPKRLHISLGIRKWIS